LELDDLAGYCTLSAAAQQLGTTYNAVYFYVRRHSIPTRRAGRTIPVRLGNLADMRVPAGRLTTWTR
jgi:hypothetical protein